MLSEKETKNISRFLSLVLRHKPGAIGITLDENGWVNTDLLIEKLQQAGTIINHEILNYIVATNIKKRFAFNDDLTLIRASQGHSVAVELGYEPQQPPAILYHGTAVKNIEAIMASGLEKRSRTHVHLSATTDTALTVGKRHGKPVIFNVHARQMHADGFSFLISENGVWLTDNVPAKYLELQDGV